MEDRDAKLARVGRLRARLPYMTQSAFVAILAAAREEPLPDIKRREDVREARGRVARSQTPYGMPHVKIQVSCGLRNLDVEIASPWPVLHLACDLSDSFSDLLLQVVDRRGPPSPSTPYKIGLYSDEITPGDQIMGKHRRKFQAVYWSIMELGPAALSCEENWFTICTMRSTEVRKIEGGMSALTSEILKAMFVGPHDPKLAGIVLNLKGRSIRFFFEFDLLTGDELSIQQINCTRGASAEMMCMCCLNVKSKWSLDRHHDTEGFFVSSTEVDMSKLRLHTDQTVIEIAKKLQARSAIEGKTKFETTQKQLGFTYSPGMITLDPVTTTIYKPISALVWDWMHCMLIDGVFAITVGEMMADLRPRHVNYTAIADFVQEWHWPRRVGDRGASGADVFTSAKIKKFYEERKFKTSASEALSLYSVMAVFVDQPHIDALQAPSITCFRLCCDVLDALQSVSRSQCTPEQLADRILRFLRFFKLCFGEDAMSPKFHYMLHIPRQYKTHGILFPCFVHERKHRELKRFAGAITNTGIDFERSLLEEITNHHMMTLQNSTFSLGPQLIKELKRAPPKVIGILRSTFGADASIAVASQARFSEWGILTREDVVVLKVEGEIRAGRIFLCAEVDGAVCFGVSIWRFVRRCSGYTLWDPSAPSNGMIDADAIVNTVLWSERDGGHIAVLAPKV